MLLCVGSAIAWDDGWPQNKSANIYQWESNPCISQVVKANTTFNLAVIPVICGTEEIEAPLPPWTFHHRFLRCDNVSIRVYNYYGTANVQDSGWINLSNYYWWQEGAALVDAQYEDYIQGRWYGYGNTYGLLFNQTINAAYPFRDFAMSGHAIYRTNLTMSHTGAVTIKVLIKSQQGIDNNEMNGQWNDPDLDIFPPGGMNPSECVAGNGFCIDSVLINLSVSMDGVEYGECKSVKGSASANPETESAFNVSLGDYATLFWLLLMVASGVAIIFIGGNKNMKQKFMIIGLLELLLLFIGTVLGLISWVYLLVLVVVATAVFAMKFKDWFG